MEELKEYCFTTATEEEDEIDICVSKDTFRVKSNVNGIITFNYIYVNYLFLFV